MRFPTAWLYVADLFVFVWAILSSVSLGIDYWFLCSRLAFLFVSFFLFCVCLRVETTKLTLNHRVNEITTYSAFRLQSFTSFKNPFKSVPALENKKALLAAT